ncbi:uncharacterized protein LOC130283090 [Hyla sarda]|uniref:uncharacterized protein LOC130283090 n=1 Tax=Hyla sarda TaxID=327740 RepID=UPI0024C44AE1|nr:uncharacterized protein LOC130283090 [Hyla sarda]
MAEEPSSVPLRGEGPSLDAAQFMTATQIQDLINKSVQAALASSIMPSGLQQQVSNISAPLHGGDPHVKKGKASHKRKHISDSPAGEDNNMLQTVPTPVCQPQHPSDSARPLGLGELHGKRRKSAKRTKPDSYVDSSTEDSSGSSNESEDYESDPNIEQDAGDTALDTDANPAMQGNVILDSLGEPLFHPDAISHPRSGDWSPLPHVAQYVELWACKSLDRSSRNKLRAECPRPFIPNKVVATPEVDPILMKYLLKSGKFPKKGIERSFKTIQERILDLMGPLTKILNLAEHAAASEEPVDVRQLRGWAQRAICLAGHRADQLPNTIIPRLLLPTPFQWSNHPHSSLLVVDPGEVVADVDTPAPVLLPVSVPYSPLSHIPVGGRLMYFTHAWSAITADVWVLQTVAGFHLELQSLPVLGVIPTPIRFSEQNAILIDNEVRDLLSKHAIMESDPSSLGFISNLFLVKKKGGGYRPVINLRDLNQHVMYRHFKMEGIHSLRDLLLPGDWLVKVDLKDAYLTVPIHPESQQFLRFLWRGRLWQFTCLPFGLSSAPWCFTKLMKPVVAALRSRGVRLIIYLDDLLIMARSKSQASLHMSWTISLLHTLGFVVNREKSVLVPAQEMEFLGFLVDTNRALLRLPKSKLALIRKEIRAVLRKGCLSLRILARLVGLLAASIQAIFPAPLHYRALQRLKILHLRQGLRYADKVPLCPAATEELHWWLRHAVEWNGKAIFNPRPDVIIESDASRLGWGARCGEISTEGTWSALEVDLHINALELLAAFFAVKSFMPRSSNCCVLLRMDNVAAVQYVNRLGGTRSKILADLAKEFWHFCLARNIIPVAEYIPGVSNTVADWNSRYLLDSSDWRLDRSIFLQLLHLWGPLYVDLFASRLNHQLPHFFSWRPDPEASAVDALRLLWPRGTHYAFPPFQLIPRVLLHTTNQRATVVLITPWWPTQPWFPLLLGMIVDYPRLLPQVPHLLTNPAGSLHPLVMEGNLPLLAWYQSTWDVSRLLDMFASWVDNDDLSLKLLSYKLTVLLCLVSIKRVSDVKALDISRRQFSPQGVKFSVVRRTKTGIHSVFYPFFPAHPRLCVVRCLQAYESQTADLRSPDFSQLLVSYVRPHHPVTSATLARWVRSAMEMAGIDVSLFGAHSSRGAMATKIVTSGGSLSDLLMAADWSSETTFRHFYFRPEDHVSMSVL